MAGVFAVLALFPDNWEMVGGRNVPLGGSAQETVDAGLALTKISTLDDDSIKEFNLIFGQVIIRRDDGMYEFNVEKAKIKEQFHFDLDILVSIFGDKLAVVILSGCEGMQGRSGSVHFGVGGWGVGGCVGAGWVRCQGCAQRTFQETLPVLIVELSGNLSQLTSSPALYSM